MPPAGNAPASRAVHSGEKRKPACPFSVDLVARPARATEERKVTRSHCQVSLGRHSASVAVLGLHPDVRPLGGMRIPPSRLIRAANAMPTTAPATRPLPPPPGFHAGSDERHQRPRPRTRPSPRPSRPPSRTIVFVSPVHLHPGRSSIPESGRRLHVAVASAGSLQNDLCARRTMSDHVGGSPMLRLTFVAVASVAGGTAVAPAPKKGPTPR